MLQSIELNNKQLTLYCTMMHICLLGLFQDFYLNLQLILLNNCFCCIHFHLPFPKSNFPFTSISFTQIANQCTYNSFTDIDCTFINFTECTHFLADYSHFSLLLIHFTQKKTLYLMFQWRVFFLFCFFFTLTHEL